MELQNLWKAVLPLGCLTGTAIAIEVMWSPFSSTLAEHRAAQPSESSIAELRRATDEVDLLPVPMSRPVRSATDELPSLDNDAVTPVEGLFPSWGRLLGRSEPAARPQQQRNRESKPQAPQFQPGDDLAPTPDPHFSGGGRSAVRPLPANPFPQKRIVNARENPIPAEPDARFRASSTPNPVAVEPRYEPSTRVRRGGGNAPTLADPLPAKRAVPEAGPEEVIESAPRRTDEAAAPTLSAPELPPLPTPPRTVENGPSLLAPVQEEPVRRVPVAEQKPVTKPQPVPAAEDDLKPVPRTARPLAPPVVSQPIPETRPPTLQPEPDNRNQPTQNPPHRRPSQTAEDGFRGLPIPRIGEGFRKLIPGFRR